MIAAEQRNGQSREAEVWTGHRTAKQKLQPPLCTAPCAGGRGFYLRNEGVLLNQALIQCALQHAYGAGCSPVMTPFFMRKDIMAECAQLEQFDEELYKVTGGPPCR